MILNYTLMCLFGILPCFIVNSVGREVIIGGHKAKVDQFKYQVSLQNNGQHICGGGIIGKKFVLTAAQCVLTNDGKFKDLNYNVLAATNDLRRTREPALIMQVHKIYVPTSFTPNYDTAADVAVVELQGEFGLPHHRHLRALQLPLNNDDSYENEKVIFAGFGWTWVDIVNGKEVGGYNDTQLRWSDAKVLAPNDACYHKYTEHHKQICARLDQHANQMRGVCAADGGSPLVYHDTVIGILSRSSFGCSERTDGATYTRIAQYSTFIRNIRRGKLTRHIRQHVVRNTSLADP